MIRLLWIFCFSGLLLSTGADTAPKWTNGPFADPGFFPLAVWVQNPKNAEKFKAAGINTYVGLWRGPSAEQLDELQRAGVWVVCSQNSYGLSNKNHPSIIAWMHGDEPDNAQSLGEKKGYGPPILPEKIQNDYERIKKADPSRPVLLNLGQGVAWDNWIGRGVRRNHPEDYPEYVKGCDIASFDIYPAVHTSPEVSGKLEFVANGVKRLRQWAGPNRTVWNCIEASRIDNEKVKPTPAQIRAEVWMSIIHGSRGLIYFVHQFKPVFKEASLLEDEELLAGVTKINKEVLDLAPVLNSPSVPNFARVKSSTNEVAVMVKRRDEEILLFAVNMKNAAVDFQFSLSSDSASKVQVGEKTVSAENGVFTDRFSAYEVKHYRIPAR